MLGGLMLLANNTRMIIAPDGLGGSTACGPPLGMSGGVTLGRWRKTSGDRHMCYEHADREKRQHVRKLAPS